MNSIPTNSIKQKAKSLGFDLAAITSTEPLDTAHIENFKNWLAGGFNGEMSWLEKNIEKRFSPALLMPQAESIICTAINYKPLRNISAIASYALYQDYHTFIKQKLSELADFIKKEVSKELKFKICVDSVPLAERALAERAGLGFIGKNHILTNPQLGSFLLLGELITNLPLKPDEPLEQKDYCKNCNKCFDACPTGAIAANQPFDANKCVSYLTIEHKGRIAKKLRPKINCIFGCDKCITACPYNAQAPVCRNRDFKFSAERQKLTAEQILKLSEKDFDALFVNSAVHRTGLRQLKRNALIFVKNKT
ncbi:MAG: tRNA epoxyqueuosine(34) reductase QueG [Phycisphaerae bacterium]|nr:tRNA epoxyqueuosine(34) reductase QueG [Phycisphaerae bacterium]